MLPQTYGQAVEIALRPLAMGVDLFFLVSGFIMVHTTAKSDGSGLYSATFLIKRFARVWPVYAVMVVLFMGYAYSWNMSAVDWPSVGRSLAFLPIDARKPPYFQLPYGLGWTLNFEMYFYLVFAISMLAGRLRWLAFFGWATITLLLVPYLYTGSVSFQPNHDYHVGIDYVDQSINPIIWDFVAGVIAGLAYRSPLYIQSRFVAWPLIAISLLITGWLASNHITGFHGIANWGAPLSLAFLVMALSFKSRAPRVPRCLTWLGEISFSLYLAHLFVFNELEFIFTRLGSTALVPTPMFSLLAVAVAIACATLSYIVLERGLSEWIRRSLLSFVAWTNRSHSARSGAKFDPS